MTLDFLKLCVWIITPVGVYDKTKLSVKRAQPFVPEAPPNFQVGGCASLKMRYLGLSVSAALGSLREI
jgi:hypothetical protein